MNITYKGKAYKVKDYEPLDFDKKFSVEWRSDGLDLMYSQEKRIKGMYEVWAGIDTSIYSKGGFRAEIHYTNEEGNDKMASPYGTLDDIFKEFERIAKVKIPNNIKSQAKTKFKNVSTNDTAIDVVTYKGKTYHIGDAISSNQLREILGELHSLSTTRYQNEKKFLSERKKGTESSQITARAALEEMQKASKKMSELIKGYDLDKMDLGIPSSLEGIMKLDPADIYKMKNSIKDAPKRMKLLINKNQADDIVESGDFESEAYYFTNRYGLDLSTEGNNYKLVGEPNDVKRFYEEWNLANYGAKMRIGDSAIKDGRVGQKGAYGGTIVEVYKGFEIEKTKNGYSFEYYGEDVYANDINKAHKMIEEQIKAGYFYDSAINVISYKGKKYHIGDESLDSQLIKMLKPLDKQISKVANELAKQNFEVAFKEIDDLYNKVTAIREGIKVLNY